MNSLKPQHSALACILFVLSASAMSAKYDEQALVEELIVSNKLSECAVALQGFSAPGICGKKWLAFDCEGAVISKSQARGQFELAQMAFALEKPIRVWFSDENLSNGRCRVYQASLAQ